MADLTIQETGITGLSPTYSTASASGDTFSNDGKTLLHVKNDGAASITVTAAGIGKCSQGFIHDLDVTVAAGGEEIIGPFDWKRFNNDQQKVSLSYSDATAVTVAAVRMGG